MTILIQRPLKSESNARNSTYLDNRGTNEQSRKIKPSYSERLANKHRTKTKLAKLLKVLGEDDLVAKMELCSSKFIALTCGSHVIGRRPTHRCDFRLCPFCASRRSKKLINKYLPMFVAFAGPQLVPVHLTLTQAHRVGESLKLSLKRLMDSFKKLSRRSFFLEFFAGGGVAVEVTLGTDGAWHSHLHLLAFRRRFCDVDQLRDEWRTVTGDSHVLRIVLVKDLERGLEEVLKYISKPLDIEKFEPKHIKQFLEIKGTRMFRAFGDFAKFCRNYEPSDNEMDGPIPSTAVAGEDCPRCGKELFETPLMTVNELIGFARRIEAGPLRL